MEKNKKINRSISVTAGEWAAVFLLSQNSSPLDPRGFQRWYLYIPSLWVRWRPSTDVLLRRCSFSISCSRSKSSHIHQAFWDIWWFHYLHPFQIKKEHNRQKWHRQTTFKWHKKKMLIANEPLCFGPSLLFIVYFLINSAGSFCVRINTFFIPVKSACCSVINAAENAATVCK